MPPVNKPLQLPANHRGGRPAIGTGKRINQRRKRIMSQMIKKTVAKTNHKLQLNELADLLLADGLINQDQYDNLQLKARFRDLGQLHPLLVIADQGLKSAQPPQRILNQEFLTEWLAQKVSLPYYRIDPLKIDAAAVTAVVSHSYAERNKLLPVEVSSTYVVIATAEPHLTGWMDELARVLRKEIRLVLTNPADIHRYIGEFYSVSRSVVGAADHHAAAPGDITNLEQLLELGKKGNLDANDQHVVNIVDWLLQYAFEQRASDIHIEPRRDKGNIRFRIDGMLHLVYQLPATIMAAVTSRLKILGRMDLAEKRRPLDGRLKTRSPSGDEVELRLSTLPTAFGEKMVMRIFDPDVLV
jgi:general secretion pathway protein E